MTLKDYTISETIKSGDTSGIVSVHHERTIPADGGFLNFERQDLCQSYSTQMCFETLFPSGKPQEKRVQYLGAHCARQLLSCPDWLRSFLTYDSQCFEAACDERQEIPEPRWESATPFLKNTYSKIRWRFVSLENRNYFPYSQNAMNSRLSLRDKHFVPSICKSQLMLQKLGCIFRKIL